MVEMQFEMLADESSRYCVKDAAYFNRAVTAHPCSENLVVRHSVFGQRLQGSLLLLELGRMLAV